MGKWELDSILNSDPEGIQELLDSGWEPFAVTSVTVTVVWFRRYSEGLSE